MRSIARLICPSAKVVLDGWGSRNITTPCVVAALNHVGRGIGGSETSPGSVVGERDETDIRARLGNQIVQNTTEVGRSQIAWGRHSLPNEVAKEYRGDIPPQFGEVCPRSSSWF